MLIEFLPPTIEMFFFPSPANLHPGNTRDTCDMITSLPDRMACIISGGLGRIFDTSDRYLLWDYTGNRQFPDTVITAYRVTRTVTNLTTGSRFSNQNDIVGTPAGSVPPRFLISHDDVLPCGQRVDYTVTAYSGMYHSMPSEVLSFDTRSCPPRGAILSIYFDELRILPPIHDTGDICAGCSRPDNTLEISGTVTVGAIGPNSKSKWMLIRSPVPYFRGMYTSMTAGSYSFSNMLLTDPLNTSDIPAILYGRYLNNMFTYRFNESNLTEPLYISALILDEETLPDRIPNFILNQGQTFTARSFEAWSTINEPFTLREIGPVAGCEVTGRVVGAPVR
jgi:hypothetical protein